MNPVIDAFIGKYEFLSNFYECEVEYDGLTYGSSEAAYQAQKAKDPAMRACFTELSPDEAKRLGKMVELRDDWDDIKDKVMRSILMAKFEQHPDLADKLRDTDGCTLVEGNWWHDNFWGNCQCSECADIVGQNRLGRNLMLVRLFPPVRDCGSNVGGATHEQS